jgi:hypothetical protein
MANADLIYRHYIADERRESSPCRPLSAKDKRIVPFAEAEESELAAALLLCDTEPRDRCGNRYRIESLQTGMSIPELRWWREHHEEPERGAVVSVRDAVAGLQSYEPVCGLTLRTLSLHRGDEQISTSALRAELTRMRNSPIVLNRGLREATLARLAQQELSMSEIAIRCGRIKRDRRGNESGETSWLARRLGLLPEAGQAAPTPWIHSDVLALIARRGLGLSPREVEVTPADGDRRPT